MYKQLKNIYFVFLAFFISSTHLMGAEYKKLIMKDNTYIEGELIEIYEDRWFFEKSTNEVQKYILIFSNDLIKPRFYLKNLKDISCINSLRSAPSQYQELLNQRGISLSSDLVKHQMVLTGNTGHHKFEKMFGNFAYDISIADKNGLTFKGRGDDLSDYFIYGAEVRSPLSGEVVGLVNNQVDNKPDPSFLSDISKNENNYITLKIDTDFYLSMVHFQKESISLKVGDFVTKGDVVGRVGNSGLSYVPHLHYTLYIYIDTLNRFISVPAGPVE